MNLTFLPAINAIDVPMIRQRVPEASREAVFASIATAMRTLPLDPTKRKPLLHDLQGLYKCRFASGLNPGEEDMRLAVFLDVETDTAVMWAVGFRDAYLPTDFYKLLRQRVQVERALGTPGTLLVGKMTRQGSRRRQRREALQTHFGPKNAPTPGYPPGVEP